jgi:hypothetical protein
MSKRPVQKHLLRLFILSLLISLIGGGAAFIYQQQQGSLASHASDDNVIGPPSLPASTVNTIFQRLGSPMSGTGQAVENASRAEKIDDAFALAVWWTETNDGAAGVGLADRNPGSVRGSVGYPSAYDGYTIYPSYAAGVTYWFSMLKQRYIDSGLTTVSAIAHPYVGTSTSDLWAGKVIGLMANYRAEAPPPTPTPKPRPPVSADARRQAKIVATQEANNLTSPKPVQQLQTIQSIPLAQTARAVSSPDAGDEVHLPLILLELLLALLLALWAVQMNRKSAHLQESVASLPGSTPLPNSPPEKLRMSNQPSLQPLSLPGTGDLLSYTLRTEELEQIATNPLMPTPLPETRLALDSFLAGETGDQLQALQTLYSTPTFAEYLSAFTIPTPAVQAPQRSREPSHTSWTPPRLPTKVSLPLAQPFHRTRLIPTQQSAGMIPPQTPAAGSENESPQPVPIEITNGNGHAPGLLSRYREMQVRSEPETDS